MNRFVRAAAAAVMAAGGAGSLGCASTGQTAGCASSVGGGAEAMGDSPVYRQFIDPCYPERYNATARAEVLAPFAAQIHNGAVMNQTIWNWYFEPGSDKLTPAGRAKLDSLAQVRPAPETRIYLQAARDVLVTPENTDKVGGIRDDLTAKRAAAVQKYMNVQPAIGGNAVAYEIHVHDPVVPGIPAEFAAASFRGQLQGYRGGIASGGGANVTATGGGTAVQINSGPAGTGTGAGGTTSGGGGGYGAPGTAPLGPN